MGDLCVTKLVQMSDGEPPAPETPVAVAPVAPPPAPVTRVEPPAPPPPAPARPSPAPPPPEEEAAPVVLAYRGDGRELEVRASTAGHVSYGRQALIIGDRLIISAPRAPEPYVEIHPLPVVDR